MNVTDPIADIFTRIRNAQMAEHRSVRIPGSKMSRAFAEVLEECGYVADTQWVDEGPQGWVYITIKYLPSGEPLIQGLRRESKPGRRVYVKKDEIPKVLNGLGISVLSTSQGVMTGKQAREASTGGELLASVW